MASGGIEDHPEPFSRPRPPPPPLLTSASIGQEVSGSWMNLSESAELHESRLPNRAADIMPMLKLKLAILSGGRDDQGRVIITFPARPRGMQYDHTQLLQTLQYLSTIPSMEASDLGFVLIVDSRLMSWSDVKMILRTSQEAMPGAVHVAYIIQPSQFVLKQQISMGLSKEKDKVEFSIVKVSSAEKLTRHIDQRQVTFDLGGFMSYNHEEWLKLRTVTEELLDAYQEYVSNSSQLETQLKPSTSLSPERLSDLQTEMSRLEEIRARIESADAKIKEVGNSLKTEIEANSGSAGMTPEMVNSLATVTRITQNTDQQQQSLRDMCEQNYRRQEQLFSLKQFELGLAKVNQWIKNKGMEKVQRVDIGDSIPKVLSIQDDLKKLESKAVAVATDVAEIRRISDIMTAGEHYAKDTVKERLKKMNAKYSKFKAALEKRKMIVTTSVAMYKGISEWRQLYDEHTAEWSSTDTLNDTESAKELLANLDAQHSRLKEIAQNVLAQGQELVKCLKSSGVSQGDPDFRKSLRFISRVTEEVTEKQRKCQETVAIRRARLDQYVQLLVCERDGKEGIKTLQGILLNLETSHGGVGISLETVTSISAEVEQHQEEAKRSHEYAQKLLQVAFQQREQLGDNNLDRNLLTELDNLASVIHSITEELKLRLNLAKKLFTAYEPTQATVKQWTKLSSQNSTSASESFFKEVNEKKESVVSSLSFCKNAAFELQELLKQPLPSVNPSDRADSNPSINESLRYLNELVSAIESQEQQLQTDLESRKVSLDQASRIKSIEQSIEDVLIWIREYGLSQFSEFLSLGFTLSTVQDQWTEFCAFKDTCQGLTKQVDELEKNIQNEPQGRRHQEAVAKTSKRIADLNRIWRRFLMRVQNREKVLTSLYQFLLESVKLASVMSEMLKSAQFQEKQQALDSTYQTTIEQGTSLIQLLRGSPDGTHDSQIAEKVTDRLKHLTNLRRQIQPLFSKTGSSKNKESIASEDGQSQESEVLDGVESEENDAKDDNQSHKQEQAEEVEDVFTESGAVGSKPSSNEAVEELVVSEEDILETEPNANEPDHDSVTTETALPEELSPVESAEEKFEEMEAKTTVLMEEFLISVMEFSQLHQVFPSQPDRVDEELEQHEKFLDQKRIELEELKSCVTSLRSFALLGNLHESRMNYIVTRIGNKLPQRISMLERRLLAFLTFASLCKLREKCTALRQDIDLFLSESTREKTRNKNVQVTLQPCSSFLKQTEDLMLECTNLSQDFTEISSEIEMKGVEARKTMRAIRQEIEETTYRCSHSLKRRKKELEASMKIEDIETKLRELISWITEVGFPSIEALTFGRSCGEARESLDSLETINHKRESIAVEVIAATEVVESAQSAHAKTKELSSELKSTNTKFQKAFSLRHEVLKATEQFFASADVLKEELKVATSPAQGSVQTLNPLVVDKLYMTLCAQAKHSSSSLQAIGGANTKQTVDAINDSLCQAEKLTNAYLLSCSCGSEDVSAVFVLLDNFLLEIQNDVQETIDAATNQQKKDVDGRPLTPVKQALQVEKASPCPVAQKSPRRGTVSSLKKLFESGSNSSEVQRRSMSLPVRDCPANSLPTRRKVSTSSSVTVVKSPTQLVKKSVFDVPASPKPVDKPATELPNTSAQVDAVVVVKAKEAPLHSAITVNIRSITDSPTPPPIPPLPKPVEQPERPPPPELSDLDTDGSWPPTPPPVRPPLPRFDEDSSQDSVNSVTDPGAKESTLSQFSTGSGDLLDREMLSSTSTRSPQEQQSSYCSSEERSDVSSSEHTPRAHTPQFHKNSSDELSHNTDLSTNQCLSISSDQEEPLDDSNYDSYLSNTSSDVYSSQNGYFSNRVIDLKMQDSIRHRDLSPVIEEMDDDDETTRDHPDIGRKKDKNDKKDSEWSRAHKQSLLSMKALINDFYQDEVAYSDTLSRLLKVYVPVLQQTGIFNTVLPIAEFQQVFLKQLSESVTTIPALCACFQQNVENFKLYFPFVLGYDTALKLITNINPDELSSLLPSGSKSSESDLIQDYTAPYHRIEIYCSLFQHLLRAAFKEDLMNLASLSETLEYLLDLLRILAMELATTKLTGCPFQVSASDILAMNPFLVHLANEVKEVYLYTVFLHPEALVISERLLDEFKEHTLYAYIMHIPISGMILIENFHGLSDRFAVCEKGQVETQNFVVFRSCEDVSVKDYWVSQLKMLLQKDNESSAPQETLLPEQVEQIGYMLPSSAPPPPGPSKRLDPLRRKKSFNRHKKTKGSDRDDFIDGYQTPESPNMENIYRVVMDHRTSGPLAHEYLSVKEGELVEVLEVKGNNYYVAKFSLSSSTDEEEEDEEEGFVPACCLEPLPYGGGLNHNSNNNAHDCSDPQNSPMESNLLESFNEPGKNVERNTDLQKDWSVFCLRTGRFDPFPECSSEHELLNAKMDSLVKYYSDQHRRLGLSNDSDSKEDEVDGVSKSLASKRSDTQEESVRRLLYKADFLDPVEEEPSYAQLNGVFSLKHPYAAIEGISAVEIGQISLRKGQLVSVLDSKREDWWLVSTFPEGDVGKREGWVGRDSLHHAEYIREDVTESSNSTSAFSIQLWLTLAKYQATDEGTISINEGELVEVIDSSRNKWSLVRTLGRLPREGWIPTEYITPYNFSEHDLPNSPLSPGISIHPSIRIDDSVSSNEGNFDFISPVSPTLSEGELDSEEKRKEALEQRDCTLEELYASEKEYVERLGYCITNYKQPIENPSSNVSKTLKAIVFELFTNIGEIHRFHKEEVLPRFEICLKNPSGLIDLFSFANSQLKCLYVTYCKGQKRSESILREYIEYFEDLRNKLKDRLSLRDYLILPIQRITKYNLLLKNIHEFSIKAGCTIPHFQTALGAAQEISRQANNAVHMSMIEVTQKRMIEFGKLVLQDMFEFADQTAKGQFKHRRVFLFEKYLVITKSKKDSPDRESYVPRETFLLNEISLGEDHDSEKKNIVIYQMGSGDKYILKAPNSRCHEEWLKKANELASLSKKIFIATAALQPATTGRTRSASEPLDVPPFIIPQGGTNSPTSLIRQGSQRLRRSARNFNNRPSSAATHKIENFNPGTRFVVMERIVPQGGEEFELEPGEEVELIKTESNGLLTICTVDEHRFTGSVPPGYLRDKELVNENSETAPKVTVLLSDLTQYLYDNISISCAFNGFPEPVVEWKRNNETVINNDRIKISSCATSSVLEISDLQYSDEGQYVCVLINDLGKDSTKMDLYIEGPPVPPSRPVASRVTPTSVKLKWNPPEHDGHSIITSYIVEQLREGFGEWQPIVRQPRTTFVVKTLSPNTWYQFRVTACNDNGESRASEPSEIVSTAKGRTAFMSPATKRKIILEDVTSKAVDETDGGVICDAVPQSYASLEDLSSIDSPSPSDQLVNCHMIRHTSVSSLYDLLPDELGRGRFGILHRCVNKTTGKVFCAKYLKQTELAMNEVKTLHGLCRGKMCDNLVQWIDALSTEANIVVIMEYVDGGELVEYILRRDCLTEGVIVGYLKQLLNALEYIHEKKVIHCDIKSENILLTGEDPPVLKLIDFGSAHTDQSQSSLSVSTLAHSLEFCAPEIINKRTVTTFADMWSVGVLAYILLSGMSPFFVESTPVMMQKVVELSYDFNHPDFHQVSPEAKDFVSMMLKRNPTQRMSAPNALQHSWIKTLGEAFGRCSSWPMPRIDLNKLKVFHTRRKLQTSVIATRASSVFRSHTSSTAVSPPPSALSEVIHTSLDMIESPPILEEGTEEVQAPVNANITLEWLFTGYPVPSVVWERNERKVTSSGRVTITTDKSLTQLSISGVVKSDEGVYTCCALNSLGSDVQECRLVVLDKPSAPFNVTGVLIETTSALVSWSRPVSSGNSPITHYILEARHIDYDHWELIDSSISGMAHVISDLLPGTFYLFRVAAVNYIGPSVFSKPSAPMLIRNEESCGSESPEMFTEVAMKEMDVQVEYDIQREIGRGHYSVVYECVERSTDRLYVAKCVPKELNSHALSEFECLKKLNHPRIVKLEEAFDMPQQTILILEHIPDGELGMLVSPMNPLGETTVARYTRHIAEGLQYLHDLGFIHTNLSPKHLLLSSGRTELKITGFSCVRAEESSVRFEGPPESPEYQAPECALQPPTCSSDLWSVGAIILFMLTGHTPFRGSSVEEVVECVRTVSISSECNSCLSLISDDCYDIVFKGLLVPNPRKRLTSHQCQRHRWLQNIGVASEEDPSGSGKYAALKHMNTEEQVQYFMTKYQNDLQSPSPSTD